MALINIDNIPQEWASTTGWTRSYNASNNLHYKDAKRPLIAPDHAEQAPTLTDLLEGENQVNPIGYCGFITHKSNPICIIDIDAPKAKKTFLRQYRESLRDQELSPEEQEQDYYNQFYQQMVEPLPEALKQLCQQTYTEYSVSGTGLHIVVKTDKSLLGTRSKAYYKAKSFSGQLSVTNNYMVTTGSLLPGSIKQIKEVPFALLSILFNIDGTSEPETTQDEIINDSQAVIDADMLPSIAEVEQALSIIPLDQSPRVKEVYKNITGEQYEHYQFWLLIGMALHDYAVQANKIPDGLQLYIKWSALDKVSFVSDEDVAAKWNSFKVHTTDGITFRTLFKIALAFQFNYPRRVQSKNGMVSLIPEKTEYVNFKYLMDKYHLKLYHANGIEVYLTGDEDIVEQYFKLHGIHKMFGYYGPFSAIQLQVATWKLCQASLWRGLTNTVNFVQAWMNEPMEEVDIFNLWLNQSNESLPPEYKYARYFPHNPRVVNNTPYKNTFEYFASCIKWGQGQDEELCRIMLYKTLMLLIKLHDPSTQAFEDNGGMFALIGRENTFKTTFFKLLLPVPLEFLRKDINQELDSEKTKRDFLRYLSTRAIVLVDEFEGFMNHKKSGAFFKSVITSNITSFIDIYQTGETSFKRKAILVGTSNDYQQIISANGSRRQWYVAIDQIDTNKMLDIDLHAFYCNLREEFHQQVAQGEIPWILKREQSAEVTKRNKSIAAESSLDLVLRDLFPYTTNAKAIEELRHFSLKDHSARFMKISSIVSMLEFNHIRVNSVAELNRALVRFCEEFIPPDAVKGQVKHGLYEHGQLKYNFRKSTGQWNHRFWVMPIEEDYDLDLEEEEAKNGCFEA